MGNSFSPCFLSSSSHPPMVKLVFWGGTTQFLTENQLAGELLFQYPDRIVCHANSFYIGHPVPTLSIDDELFTGHTYFVLPVDCFPCHNLTTASLASLSSSKQKPSLVGSGSQFPFEYVKSTDGKMLIKVLPEFIIGVISAAGDGGDTERCAGDGGSLCSTPELRKHYAQLVGSRERPWSPTLETISERKARLSPARLLGLERRI